MSGEPTVDLFLLRIDRLNDDALDRLLSCLSSDERKRAARFHFRADACRHIASRGALRQLLGQRLARPPKSLVFAALPGGKPWLTEEPSLNFSVSHSRDLALIAIARDRRVGIDVEAATEHRDPQAIARRYFASAYLRHLARLRFAEASHSFTQLWCRFEALQKAEGCGICDGARLPAGPLPTSSPLGFGQLDKVHRVGNWVVADVGLELPYHAAIASEAKTIAVTVQEFPAD